MPSPRTVYVGVLVVLCALQACDKRRQTASSSSPSSQPSNARVVATTQFAEPKPAIAPASRAAAVDAPAATRPTTQPFALLLSKIEPKDEETGWLWVVLGNSLRDPDPDVRLAAVNLAGRLAPTVSGSARGLIDRAYDSDASVRAAAMEVLSHVRLNLRDPLGVLVPADGAPGAIGRVAYVSTHPIANPLEDPRGTQLESLFTVLLNTSRADLRQQALATLPTYGENAYRALAAMLPATKPPNRSLLFTALGTFAVGGPRPASPELLRITSDVRAVDRGEAIALLARLSPRDPRAWAQLLEAAADPPERVRWYRGVNPRTAGRSALAEHAGEPDVALQLAYAMLDDRLAPSAADAFHNAGDAAAPAAIPALLVILPDAPPAVEARVAATIGSFGPAAREATGTLQDLLRSPDASVRIAAAEALAAIGPDAASAGPALAARLRDPDPRVRSAAAYALTRTGPANHDLAADLLTAVRRKDRTLCTILAPNVKLDGDSGKRVRPQLADLARHDPDEATRTLAWTALHDMGDPLAWRYSDRRAGE